MVNAYTPCCFTPLDLQVAPARVRCSQQLWSPGETLLAVVPQAAHQESKCHSKKGQIGLQYDGLPWPYLSKTSACLLEWCFEASKAFKTLLLDHDLPLHGHFRDQKRALGEAFPPPSEPLNTTSILLTRLVKMVVGTQIAFFFAGSKCRSPNKVYFWSQLVIGLPSHRGPFHKIIIVRRHRRHHHHVLLFFTTIRIWQLAWQLASWSRR